MVTSEHLELRRDLASLLQGLNALPQQAGVGRRKGYGRGVACCVVQDELSESVQQEDRGSCCH